MSDENVIVQVVYGSSDVADILQIKESTLRKYCLLLEKQGGYEFLKNEQGQRAYFDNDLIVLKKMIKLKDSADMTLEEAVKAVVAWKNGNDITVGDIEEKHYVARYNDIMEEFKSYREEQTKFNEQQMQFNKQLIEEIQKQQQYIENRLEERDRLLVESMRQALETRREIATAEKKKWWQFWK